MHIEKLSQIFESFSKISVPSYQRAYSWEVKQLEQFVNDLREISDKGGYYFGHFIFEKTNNNWEIIDGQQRLTTFVLFNIICDIKLNQKSKEIEQFETVNYDQNCFTIILNNAFHGLDFSLGLEENEITQSIKKMIFALDYFMNQFNNNTLKFEKIKEYLKTLQDSSISVHLAYDKKIAVQIFELHNTRGLSLSLIEKVKSKLMKAVFINSENSCEVSISEIQQYFAEIYKIEEKLDTLKFRGKLSIEEIVLRSLRMINDGSKLHPRDKHEFNTPSPNNRSESILNYLDEQIHLRKNNTIEVIDYCLKVSFNFCEIVKFIILELPKIDSNNRLIGDVLILERSLSIQFFILIRQRFPNEYTQYLSNHDNLIKWEKLLYIRDFHSSYYGLRYGDDFENLFFQIVGKSITKDVNTILDKYLLEGFRKEKMNINLTNTVKVFLETHKTNILSDAYNFWREKMAYAIYKYEISQGSSVELLREVHHEGRSIEHILPGEWQLDWINEKNQLISENDKQFNEKIENIINGIGNLLLITESENSKLSNNHPKNKKYVSCNGGTYEKHNKGLYKWDDHEKWPEIIENRGVEIYEFMLKYFIND
jgi:hypothetical protein